MTLNIHEYDPIENAYKIDVSICVREDVIDSTIYKLDSVLKMLIDFKKTIIRSK